MMKETGTLISSLSFITKKQISMVKRKLSQEEKDLLRAQWRKNNPEKAAERDRKRAQALAANSAVEEKEQLEEENLLFSEQPRAEAVVEEYRKKIKALWEMINSKREQYVHDRDLEASRLDDESKQSFKHFVIRGYDSPNQTISAVVGALLIEGLRYPDRQLNDFSYNFFREKETASQNISWSFWVNLWDRDFVPLDAVRLMLEIEDGHFKPLNRFKEMVHVISAKMVRHLEQEYRRLEWAQALEDEVVRRKEVARKSRRIFYFQALLGAYGIEYPALNA